jgi:hypothetical protein
MSLYMRVELYVILKYCVNREGSMNDLGEQLGRCDEVPHLERKEVAAGPNHHIKCCRAQSGCIRIK